MDINIGTLACVSEEMARKRRRERENEEKEKREEDTCNDGEHY